MPQQRQGLPAGRPVVWDDRIRLWGDASVVLGGAPWGVLRIAPAGRDFLRRLRAAGPRGLAASPGVEQTLVDLLLARGIVHPAAVTQPMHAATAVEIVVPAYQRPELLEACLISLRQTAPGFRTVVVDDASTSPRVAEVARAHGATVLRHEVNRGPAAARNTGLREVDSPIVVFVDADCVATPGWLNTLVTHFDDPRVAAVAPRIVARTGSRSMLARYEAAHSALDSRCSRGSPGRGSDRRQGTARRCHSQRTSASTGMVAGRLAGAGNHPAVAGGQGSCGGHAAAAGKRVAEAAPEPESARVPGAADRR